MTSAKPVWRGGLCDSTAESDAQYVEQRSWTTDASPLVSSIPSFEPAGAQSHLKCYTVRMICLVILIALHLQNTTVLLDALEYRWQTCPSLLVRAAQHSELTRLSIARAEHFDGY